MLTAVLDPSHQEFAEFTRHQNCGARPSPPLAVFYVFGKNRIRDKANAWHDVVEFEQAPRHVICGRN